MISTEARQLIHKRLRGALTAGEAKIFEEHLKNPEFREHFAQQMAMGLAFLEIDAQEDRQVLSFLKRVREEAEAEYPPATTTQSGATEGVDAARPPREARIRRIGPAWRWGVAAAILVLLSGFAALLIRENREAHLDLFSYWIAPDGPDQRGDPNLPDRLAGCESIGQSSGPAIETLISCLEGKIEQGVALDWYAHFTLGDLYKQRKNGEDYAKALIQLDSSYSKLIGLDENLKPASDQVEDRIIWNRLLIKIELDKPGYKAELENLIKDDSRFSYKTNAVELHKKLHQAKRF